MSQPAPSPARARLGHARALRRNVVVSTMGIAARSSQLVLLFMIGRRFGPDALGHFLLGVGLFEVVAAVVSTGFADGTLLFVSRQAARGRRGRADLVDVVATALLVGGGVAFAVASAATFLLTWFAGAPVIASSLVSPAVVWLGWALLPNLVARICFAATSGLLRLEWEVLVGTAGPPLALLLVLPVVHAAGGGVGGLFAALFAVQVITALLALFVLGRRLRAVRGGRNLWAALRRPRIDRALLRFALPQGLNVAAGTYIARLDVFMLAALGMPAAVVGGYGAIAALVLELRQIRMLVSGALAPIAARLHAARDHAALARTLSRSVAVVASIAVPIALGFVVMHADVVDLLAPALAGDAHFALVLLIGPLCNCFGGLAGNFLIYFLRNRWNLANAILVAAAHTGLCWLFIPRLGLAGAALAGSLAMATVTLLENLELALLDRVRIAPRALVRPAVTLAVGAVALAAAAPLLRGSDQTSTRIAAAVTVALVAAAAIRRWRWPGRAVARPLEAAL